MEDMGENWSKWTPFDKWFPPTERREKNLIALMAQRRFCHKGQRRLYYVTRIYITWGFPVLLGRNCMRNNHISFSPFITVSIRDDPRSQSVDREPLKPIKKYHKTMHMYIHTHTHVHGQVRHWQQTLDSTHTHICDDSPDSSRCSMNIPNTRCPPRSRNQTAMLFFVWQRSKTK